MVQIQPDEPSNAEKRIIKPQRSRWHRFVKNYLAHNFDCENRLELPDIILQCHMDFAHKGLHQAPAVDGVWVWSTDKHTSGFVPRQ